VHETQSDVGEAIPAMYWPRAIRSPVESSPRADPGREVAMILIAFRCSASVSSHAPRVVYPSIAWVRASIPVATSQIHRYARHHVGVHDRHNGDVVGCAPV